MKGVAPIFSLNSLPPNSARHLTRVATWVSRGILRVAGGPGSELCRSLPDLKYPND
jgi:hypothetical protein